MEDGRIIIDTEKGSFTCEILAILSQGENEYVMLLPLNKNEKAADDVFIYQLLASDEKDKEHLANITDPEVYKVLYQQFLTTYSTPGISGK